MTALLQVYKCEKCGNMVEIIHAGMGTLSCCDQDMILMDDLTIEAATEKHLPVIEKTANGYKVTVGEVIHPMVEKHYIEWIELIADGVAYRKFLKPDDEPVAEFCISANKVSAREFCNLHGIWKTDQ